MAVIRLESRVDNDLTKYLKSNGLLDSTLSPMIKNVIDGVKSSCSYATTTGQVVDLLSVNTHLMILERSINEYARGFLVDRNIENPSPRVRVLCTHSFGTYEGAPAEFLDFLFYRADEREPDPKTRILGQTSPLIIYH